MLDATITFGVEEKKEYPQIPKGIYEVSLEEVNAELKETYNSKTNKTKEKEFENQLKFRWKIQKGAFQGQLLFTDFVPTTFFVTQKNGKNKLYKICEALMCKELDVLDVATFTNETLNGLVGKMCTVVVETTAKGDKTFSNITTWLANEQAIPTLEKKHEEINPLDIKF